jgi:hypothetical protein
MPAPDVVLWNAGDVLGDPESAEAEYELSAYVTEIVLRASKPRAKSRLIAIRQGGSGAEIVGVGVVASSQRVATGKDRVRVEPLVRVPGIPVRKVQEEISRGPVDTDVDLDAPPPLRPRALSAKRGELVLAALAELSPEIADLLTLLRDGADPITGTRGQRIREERDAISFALDVARIDPRADDLRADSPQSGQERGLEGLLAPEAIYDVEDDLIAEDLRRFDKNGTLELTHASAARFTDRGFSLTIVNVNRKGLEKVKGVDLVYWDVPADSYTLVQYKRLTRRHGGEGDERWAYTDRAELEKALARMDAGQGRMADAAQFRLATSPYWFKFVRADAFTPGDPMVLLGMYVPAEYMRRAVEDGSLLTGAKQGFEVTYGNTRYLARGTFVDLVRKSMVGTTGKQTAEVLQTVNSLAEERQALLAVRMRADG